MVGPAPGNAQFIEADLATLTNFGEIPEADIATLHGLWSWVADTVRSGIVRLLARSSGTADGVRPRPGSRFETFRPAPGPVAEERAGPPAADLGTPQTWPGGSLLDAAVNSGA